jgi:hypothetical protein
LRILLLIPEFKGRQLSRVKTEGVRRVWCGRALLVAALASYCVFAAQAQAQSRQSRLVGKPAPSFQLQGIYNETYSLDQFKGHILVMQFGSSW